MKSTPRGPLGLGVKAHTDDLERLGEIDVVCDPLRDQEGLFMLLLQLERNECSSFSLDDDLFCLINSISRNLFSISNIIYFCVYSKNARPIEGIQALLMADCYSKCCRHG